MKKIVLLYFYIALSISIDLTAQGIITKQVKFTFTETSEREIENVESGVIFFDTNKKNYYSIQKSIPLEESAPFIAVGLIGKISGVYDLMGVSIRFSADSVKWSEWKQFKIDNDIEQDSRTRISSLMFEKPVNKFYQIQVDADYFEKFEDGKSFQISFLNPGATGKNILDKAEIISKNNSVKGEFDLPTVISRTEWGCPDGQNSRWSPNYTKVTHLIVHHSATENLSSDWPAVVRTFWGWHTITNGWGDIGYNFLVDPNGVVYEGRSGGNNAIGAHFCGTNSNTMGTCVIGTYTSVPPTDKAITSLVKILTWKCNLENINPLGTAYHSSSGRTLNNISGHRDGCSTECPGTTLYNNLSSVRSDVLSLLNSKGPFVSEPVNKIKYNHPAYKPLTLSFSQSMDKQSVESSLTIEPDDSVKLRWIGSNELIISPAALWKFSTRYDFKIDTSARSIFGTKLDGDNDGQSGGVFNYSVVITDPDFEAPKITRAFPSGNSVNTNAEMKFVFNEEVDGIIGRISLLDSLDKTVSILDGKIIDENDITYITFRPKNVLSPSATYKVSFKSGIADFLGNTMLKDSLFVFRTDNGNYPVGKTLQDFENEYVMADPASNQISTGISLIGTSFKRSGYRSVEGLTSGLLTYEFSADTGGIINLMFLKDLQINETDSILCIWINGDLSDNSISAIFNGGEIVADISTVNWYGWEVFEIALNQFVKKPYLLSGFRLKQMEGADRRGKIYLDKIFVKDLGISSINDLTIQPGIFKLEQNFPNPFNPSTEISYSIATTSLVTLEIYNLLGQKIKSLTQALQKPGQYTLGVNLSGNEKFASGVYFYRLIAHPVNGGNIFSSTKKMILLN